ncbi:hypothetical protein AT575_03525 [Streptococcus penaeicida]|uniref:DUF465 domain-containing protein n=1 Tax=Streptococcus penaeicida TaxID=1765960 RepID=A0A2N8LCS4_9STRE|nr:hypothetical protein [Streptococcus penaeicida]PND47957.1 hypothetical protein AT575_03525 [Streptococcus penaeicida]
MSILKKLIAKTSREEDRQRYIDKNRASYLEELAQINDNIQQLKDSKNPSQTRLNILMRRKERIEAILANEI